jgi:hypothetical protein
MTYAIRIATQQPERSSDFFFEKSFSTIEEFQKVTKLCDNKQRIGFFDSLVFPIRMNNVKNFCTDFFLPTFFNHALTINNIVIKIICSITCCLLDICTLPIRVFTLIPRYFDNPVNCKEKHPFYHYLIQNGATEKQLSADHVYLELQWSNSVRIWDGIKEKYKIQEELTRNGETFNFINLPTNVSAVEKESGYIGKSHYRLPYHN